MTEDPWAQWLLHGRHGDDPEELARVRAALGPVRDRVLANASIERGDVVLDVGTGDGLIAFGALELTGGGGRVVFSDVSETLLAICRRRAMDAGVAQRCDFVRSAADELPVADASVDVVTTRSVLIYVEDKLSAFREFHRVLRRGGRISIFEPINRFGHPAPEDRLWGYDVGPVAGLARKIKAVFERAQPTDSDPMLNFDERDLVGFAEEAGFFNLRLEYEAEIKEEPVFGGGWNALLRFAGNPRMPTLGDAIAVALTVSERDEFERHLRPLVESGRGITRAAVAYLVAVK